MLLPDIVHVNPLSVNDAEGILVVIEITTAFSGIEAAVANFAGKRNEAARA
jgi:hypothetical protein